MGWVWLAFDTLSDEWIALKLLSEPLGENPAVRGRLLRELKAGRRVTHPNVCRVHDLGRHRGRLFVTMEFVDGSDLHGHLIDNRGSLTLAERFGLCIDVAEALEAIHAAGILHRDLKPANVLVARDGKVQVTDFGLSRLMESGSKVDVSGPFIGTPGYMSPEQLLGGDIDRRADIYSFAVLAFEVFTGRPLFAGSPGARILGSITDDIDLTSESWWDLPEQVAGVLARCLDRDRAQRPADATSLLADLRAASEGVAHELSEAGVPDLSAADRAQTGLRAFRCPPAGTLPEGLLTLCFESGWTQGESVEGAGWVRFPDRTPVRLDVWGGTRRADFYAEVQRAARSFDPGALAIVALEGFDGSPGESSLVETLLSGPVDSLSSDASSAAGQSTVAHGARRCLAAEYSSVAGSDDFLSDDLLRAFESWPHLRDLHLNVLSGGVTPQAWSHLGSLRQLRKLNLRSTRGIGGPHKPGEELTLHVCEALGRLTNLRELVLCEFFEYGSPLLEALSKLTSLERLEVPWNVEWPAEQFLSLPSLPRLVELDFGRRGSENPTDPAFLGSLLTRLSPQCQLSLRVDGASFGLLAEQPGQLEERELTVSVGPIETDTKAFAEANSRLSHLDIRSADSRDCPPIEAGLGRLFASYVDKLEEEAKDKKRARSSRDMMSKHYDSGQYLDCPVCQHAIDCDHDEALKTNQALSAPPR